MGLPNKGIINIKIKYCVDMVLAYYLEIHKADNDKCGMVRIKVQKLRTFVFTFLSQIYWVKVFCYFP